MHDDHNDRRSGKGQMSWTEIDKIRNKSHHRDRDPMQKQSSPVVLAAQKSYRAALERAFEAGKLGELARTLTKADEPATPSPTTATATASPRAATPGSPTESSHVPAPLPPAPPAPERDPERENRQKLLAKIRDAKGRDAVTRAVDAFLAKYVKLPDDYELLTRALDHKDDDRISAALDQLSGMLARDKPRRGRALAAQLRFIEDTHDQPGIRKYAAEVRSRL